MLPKGKEQQVAERVRAVNALLLESCFFSTQRQVRARAGARLGAGVALLFSTQRQAGYDLALAHPYPYP